MVWAGLTVTLDPESLEVAAGSGLSQRIPAIPIGGSIAHGEDSLLIPAGSARHGLADAPTPQLGRGPVSI